MKTITNLSFVFAVILSVTAIQLQAQDIPESGSIGLRANFTGQPTIEVPYMLNEELSLAPYIGINSTQDQSTNFSIGVRPRYYMSQDRSLATYITGALGFSNTSFSNNNINSVTNFNLGIGYGAEYFFTDQFSVSSDANLGTRFGDSDTNVATSARISASIYF
ncbi:MAG: outer membrane beta-barrel protein [Gracilimonas sp.]|nr:outer membrane beta-barrel protein [Gracilimonas sp.]